MSETQSYKTVTFTHEQALDLEIAIAHRIRYLQNRFLFPGEEIKTEIASLNAASAAIVTAPLSRAEGTKS